MCGSVVIDVDGRGIHPSLWSFGRSLGHSRPWSLSPIGTPCRKGSRHPGRIGAGEAKPEVAPRISSWFAAGGSRLFTGMMSRVKLQISLSSAVVLEYGSFSGRMGR